MKNRALVLGSAAAMLVAFSAPAFAQFSSALNESEATAKEAKEFRDEAAAAKQAADDLAAASRVQFTVVPTADLKRLKDTKKD